ncbi:Holliday junction branch migration protein RuvA [Patescibacteria group bacterium]
MIGYLSGSLIYKENDYIVLDVSSVGYKIFVPKEVTSSKKISKRIDLFIHTAVRENSLDLYGFREKDELKFFELLIGISGIGPKSALGILNTATIPTLNRAILSGDTSYLTKVSGIGNKNAQKIILELKNKIDATEEYTQGSKEDIEVIEALKSLGYSPKEAVEALQKTNPETTDTSDRIKEALKNLSK